MLPELIEAAARNGDLAIAGTAFDQLAERSSLSNTEWARGIEARSRALLTDGQDAEDLYREAIEQLWAFSRRRPLTPARNSSTASGFAVNIAASMRAAQLKAAYAAFDAMGAKAFAEGAQRELLATGETVRKRTADTKDALTSQEAQIARLALRRPHQPRRSATSCSSATAPSSGICARSSPS